MRFNLFKEYPETEVTYINKVTNEAWPKWKKYKDCEPKERLQVNLRQIFPNEILLDLEEEKRLEEIKLQLDKLKLNYYVYKTGSRGYHFHLFFNNIAMFSKERRNEIRKVFIKLFKTDESKASENTLIAIENRPHFKTGNEKCLIEEKPGENVIEPKIITEALQILEKYKEKKVQLDVLFTNYHNTDPFFSYIKNNKIPDAQGRNNIIFPNIAIALVKEGLSEEQIEEVMKPIIKNNFPGKTYSEFKGWLHKAFSGEIDTYNNIQLNKWYESYTKQDKGLYDTSPLAIEMLSDTSHLRTEIAANQDLKDALKEPKKRFFADDELDSIENIHTEWLVEKWIPKGDICFIAGKAASFKTTATLHIAYAISTGKLVFNSYPTKQCKVLYLNEENSNNLFLNMISRVKKGLDLKDKTKNIYFSFLENFRLDKVEDLTQLIEYIQANKIELLVCDSFRRFIGFDENKATEMNQLFNNLKVLRKACNGLTIVILHHLKKENTQNQGDVRDSLRGSSDIVNSADSIIAIKRKHGQNAFIIEHIKNRAAEEMIGKLIILGDRDDAGCAYFYESDKEIDKELVLSAPESCATEIVKFLEDKQLKVFSKSDLGELLAKYSNPTIVRALSTLKNEGTINQAMSGKYSSYTFNNISQTTLD